MSSLNDQYMRIEERIEGINNRLDKIDSNTKEYIKLCDRKTLLTLNKQMLYRDIKMNTYDTCKHMTVTYNDLRCERKVCIKCGLDEIAINNDVAYDSLNYSEKLMRDYMSYKNMDHIDGIDTGACCDASMAHAIYLGITKNIENLNDDELKDLFNKTLDEIRSDVKETINFSGAKRIRLVNGHNLTK